MEKLNPVDRNIDIDELYTKAITPMNENPNGYTHYYKNCIIHMVDSVSRGYISKLEAYEALKSDYFPEYLTLRPSNYKHLL